METAIGFRPEYLDFQRGIRVGNLEERERITRILKIAGIALWRELRDGALGPGCLLALDRLCFAFQPCGQAGVGQGQLRLRQVLPLDGPRGGLFQCGMGVERGYVKAPREARQCQLAEDWDWHRLIRALRPKSPMERELARLLARIPDPRR